MTPRTTINHHLALNTNERITRLEDGLTRLHAFADCPEFDVVCRASSRLDALRAARRVLDTPIPYRLATPDERRLAKVAGCFPSDGDA